MTSRLCLNQASFPVFLAYASGKAVGVRAAPSPKKHTSTISSPNHIAMLSLESCRHAPCATAPALWGR